MGHLLQNQWGAKSHCIGKNMEVEAVKFQVVRNTSIGGGGISRILISNIPCLPQTP